MTRVLLHKLWISVTRGYSYDQSFTNSLLHEWWILITRGYSYDQSFTSSLLHELWIISVTRSYSCVVMG